MNIKIIMLHIYIEIFKLYVLKAKFNIYKFA